MPKFSPQKHFSLYEHGTHNGKMSKASEFLSELMKAHIEVGGVELKIYRLKGTFEQEDDALGISHTENEEVVSVEKPLDMGSFLGIQDPILGENRDREYDFDEIPILKGVYTVSQNELDYARYGLALANDIITMEFHAREMERECGRRLIPGDVVELPHLRDVGLDGRVANKWYQVSSIVWSPTGYDPMYMRHILGCILKPLRDQQEFIDILEREDEYGKTLREQISNRDKLMDITEHNQDLASEHVPVTGWDVSNMYIDPNNPDIIPYIWTDDGAPPDGSPVGKGDSFPQGVAEGTWFLRTDLYPNRLYQLTDGRWRMREVDRKREWQPYTWVESLRRFMSDRSESDQERFKNVELRSIHDVITPRHRRSKPSPKKE